MNIIKLGIVVMLAVLSSFRTIGETPVNGIMTAIAGTRFSMGEPNAEGVLPHTVDGVAQVSEIGNCVVHFDVETKVPPPGEPWILRGTMYFLHPQDGSILRMRVAGWALIEEGTPFGNLHYDAEVISGEGLFAGARGKGEINGVAMFINAEGDGTATWTFRGNIFTRPKK